MPSSSSSGTICLVASGLKVAFVRSMKDVAAEDADLLASIVYDRVVEHEASYAEDIDATLKLGSAVACRLGFSQSGGPIAHLVEGCPESALHHTYRTRTRTRTTTPSISYSRRAIEFEMLEFMLSTEQESDEDDEPDESDDERDDPYDEAAYPR